MRREKYILHVPREPLFKDRDNFRLRERNADETSNRKRSSSRHALVSPREAEVCGRDDVFL